jgi:hypothetical protein
MSPALFDQDVQAAEAIDNLRHGLFGLGAVGDVGRDGMGGAAGGFDLGHEFVEAVLAPGDDGDGRSLLGEAAGGGLTDAAARAGY